MSRHNKVRKPDTEETQDSDGGFDIDEAMEKQYECVNEIIDKAELLGKTIRTESQAIQRSVGTLERKYLDKRVDMRESTRKLENTFKRIEQGIQEETGAILTRIEALRFDADAQFDMDHALASRKHADSSSSSSSRRHLQRKTQHAGHRPPRRQPRPRSMASLPKPNQVTHKQITGNTLMPSGRTTRNHHRFACRMGLGHSQPLTTESTPRIHLHKLWNTTLTGSASGGMERAKTKP